MHRLSLSSILICIPLATSASSYGSIIDNYEGQYGEAITRDVCVIGGGASGAHAAAPLKDLNKTAVTGTPIDIGVVVSQPLPAVFAFFSKFNVPLLDTSTIVPNAAGQPANKSVPAPWFNTVQVHTDFRDGSAVDIPQDGAAVGLALQGLAAVMSKYAAILNGYEFLPDPVPKDLVLPFGDFMNKYNPTAAIPIVRQIAQGQGDLINIPTLYVIKYFNIGDIAALTQGYLTEAKGNNSLLYTRVAEYLGSGNILFQSTVVSANRQKGNRSQLLVSTPGQDRLKLLSCGQILFTIPPTQANLQGWDLTDEEEAIFAQLTGATGYWTGLAKLNANGKGPGMNQTVTHQNAASTTSSNIPVLPALYGLSPVGVLDDVWWIKFAADTPTLTMIREIQTLQRANNVSVTDPEWLIFDSHSPFMLRARSEDIEKGFYKRLTGLQGSLGGRMFYSGAAYNLDVVTVIPKMMKGSA
ncbi:hypothetical protein QBC46DRAFT_364078 [Diplogelasinospora grovesii]|uniref:Uncharacterized protein n=1 Tax=Diplogelasinospora grovesii TaxID=303347 RepID=A0AAN6N724_9PEZI|nr:hypothetical protein QBC46DRAFT_364078 [Diplogelasinospora grovesii]